MRSTRSSLSSSLSLRFVFRSTFVSALLVFVCDGFGRRSARRRASPRSRPATRRYGSRVESGGKSHNQDEISRAIEKLKQLKIDLNAEITRRKESGDVLIKSKEDFRQKVANSLESRLFYIPSFKIYGGVGGLYDYGESSLVFAARARASVY